MSYAGQEDWVHVDTYFEAIAKIEELERMLKSADIDEAWLEQQNKELRQQLDYARSEIKDLELELAKATVPC
jgi:chromosome segregation ATPase